MNYTEINFGFKEQIGNLKIQLEMTRETHREQSTAAQAKYLALERVCHRQEGHILELYGHMERVAMLSRQRCRGGSSQEPIVIPDSLVGPKEILSLGHSGNQASSGANDWYLPFLFNDSIVAPPAGSDGAESGFHGGNFDRSEVVLPILDDDRLEETSQSVGMGSMSAHKFPNTLL